MRILDSQGPRQPQIVDLVSIVDIAVVLFEDSLYFLDIVMSGCLVQVRALAVAHLLPGRAADQ